MPQIIQLPEPCHEEWSQMTPEGRGRHCAQCCKTVVDFTAWQPEEIVLYLQTHTGACGRFRKDQLHVPLPSPEDFVLQIVHTHLSFIKKLAAIFLFVFGLMAGTSCNQPRQSGSGPTAAATVITPDTAIHIMGDTLIPPPPVVNPKAKSVRKEEGAHTIVGEPAIVEQPEVLGGVPVMAPVPEIVPVNADSAKRHTMPSTHRRGDSL